jgi:hypothetical protein
MKEDNSIIEEKINESNEENKVLIENITEINENNESLNENEDKIVLENSFEWWSNIKFSLRKLFSERRDSIEKLLIPFFQKKGNNYLILEKLEKQDIFNGIKCIYENIHILNLKNSQNLFLKLIKEICKRDEEDYLLKGMISLSGEIIKVSVKDSRNCLIRFICQAAISKTNLKTFSSVIETVLPIFSQQLSKDFNMNTKKLLKSKSAKSFICYLEKFLFKNKEEGSKEIFETLKKREDVLENIIYSSIAFKLFSKKKEVLLKKIEENSVKFILTKGFINKFIF